MKTIKLDKAYEPHPVEDKWYKFWLEKELFKAVPFSKKLPFSMVIPPPNVTGSLHMGHALNNTLQDILARYKRMDGFSVLWLPGTDHAGIATQNVVEKALHQESLDRHTIGRDAFVKKVWEWKEKYGGIIFHQLRKIGSTCDWSRERFTMDEGLSKAVREVFVRLKDEGLIYRSNYMINWCPRCHTALSDLEAEHEDIKGGLYHIRYPMSGREDDGLIIATTRPETMLGDTAVAVNPEDDRYKDLVGENLILPLAGRELPIISDSHVDPSFGTGALKITPAHDPNDFEIGLRHNLEQVIVIGRDGRMTTEAGPLYKGLDRFECRKRILKDLEKEGLLVKVEDHEHGVGNCYRCKTIVEPLISLQWFVKTKPLAEEAIKAVKDGKTKIIPKGWENTYFHWMENIRDWCISRQIWWGHRIPAWYCTDCFGDQIEIVFSKEITINDAQGKRVQRGNYSDLKKYGLSHNEILENIDSYTFGITADPIVALSRPDRCSACGSKNLLQDPDVLDTWFSSALWPFSTMGWPEKTKDLEFFYPTSVLVTGFDIIFFWVARMMMMGLKFMKEAPFREVYIHALIRDAEGQKMSKSKGNVIDPLLMMDKYGTDALRYTLAAFAAQGRDIKLSEDRIEGYRNFCNKIWNVARFAMLNKAVVSKTNSLITAPSALSLPDRWILSSLNRTVGEVRKGLDEYRFNDVAASLYRFIWHEFCDWYVEIIKPDLRGERGDERKEISQKLLLKVLMDSMKLLHPIMPFISEELWSVFSMDRDSIMNAPFPKVNKEEIDRNAEDEMTKVFGTIKCIRNFRSEHRINPSLVLKEVYIRSNDPVSLDILKKNRSYITDLSKVSSLSFEAPEEDVESFYRLFFEDIEVFLPSSALPIDIDEEKERLVRKRNKIEKELGRLKKKLENKKFLTRAPAEVVAKEKGKVRELTEELEKILTGLEKLKNMKKADVQN